MTTGLSPYLLIVPLIAGYLADLLMGDPEVLPHPIRLFGRLIAVGESRLNRGSLRFYKGMLLTIVLSAGCFGFFFLLDWLIPGDIPRLCLSSVFVFYGLANRQLVREGNAVFTVLEKEGVEGGRRQLSRIVGRDTAELDLQQIRIAVLETLSENLSDGVIAPLFWYAVAGVPGMMTYKMINTMDSMIGYRDPRYEQFGKFAARLDDVVNFIPARLTALLMVVVSVNGRGARFALRYGRLHKSPNAGYPEAALAGILDLRFGGPNRYHGLVVEKPFIGARERPVEAGDIARAAGINQRVCLLMIGLIILFTFAKPFFAHG